MYQLSEPPPPRSRDAPCVMGFRGASTPDTWMPPLNAQLTAFTIRQAQSSSASTFSTRPVAISCWVLRRVRCRDDCPDVDLPPQWQCPGSSCVARSFPLPLRASAAHCSPSAIALSAHDALDAARAVRACALDALASSAPSDYAIVLGFIGICSAVIESFKTEIQL